MEITVFAKKRHTNDGKSFFSYLATLKKKTGENVTVSVRFREDAGNPKPENCPMNIIINKTDANLSSRVYTREDTGEDAISYTLWVSAWSKGAEYVDHSLDEFE